MHHQDTTSSRTLPIPRDLDNNDDDVNDTNNDDYDGVRQHSNQPEQQQQQQQPSAEEIFSQCVSDGLMAIEELRQSLIQTIHSPPQQQNHQQHQQEITVDSLQVFQYHMNHIVQVIHRMDDDSTITTASTDTTNQLLYDHVVQKAREISQQVVHTCLTEYVEPTTVMGDAADETTGNDTDTNQTLRQHQHSRTTAASSSSSSPLTVEEQRRIGQGCLARMTELYIHLLQVSSSVSSTNPNNDDDKYDSHTQQSTSSQTHDDIADIQQRYVQFQKRTLRGRCKPYIAQLIQVRRQTTTRLEFNTIPIEAAGTPHDTNNNNNNNNSTTTRVTAGSTNRNTNHITTDHYTSNNISNNDVNDDDDDDDSAVVPLMDLSTFTAQQQQPSSSSSSSSTTVYHAYHSPVVTILLGTAATLIHPLLSWMNHLQPPLSPPTTTTATATTTIIVRGEDNSRWILYQMCQQSVDIINEQTQTLVGTINDWFYDDRKVLMNFFTNPTGCAATTTTTTPQSLGQLNGLVDEMAYIAQILERYQTLIDTASQHQLQGTFHATTTTSTENRIGREILPEWIWQYSTFERILVLQQWQLSIHGNSTGNDNTTTSATPVCIVIGTNIHVSSCIEDAQYISTRTMDRAISTQSLDAISAVAYTVIHDIWATDDSTNINHNHQSPNTNSPNASSSSAVYQALMDEIGCWSLETSTTTGTTDHGHRKLHVVSSSPASGSNAFASALLDALDDDLGASTTTTTTTTTTSDSFMKTPIKTKPPSSGGTNFLSSLILSSSIDNDMQSMVQQRQLDTLYCVLNSIYAASGACTALANTLDDILLDYTNGDDNNDNTIPQLQMQQQVIISSPSDDSGTPQTSATIVSKTATVTAAANKAISKIQLTRDDAIQYSKEYQQMLVNRIDESINEWCFNTGSKNRSTSCLYQLHKFFTNESYHITDGATFQTMEQEERLLSQLIVPLQQCTLLQQFTTKCEIQILMIIAERIATMVVDIIVNVLWSTPSNSFSSSSNNDDTTSIGASPKRFTDWGALLLSKQSRMLQKYISTTMIQPPPSATNVPSSSPSKTSNVTATKVIRIWERLSHLITVLQLEKPMDWITYYHSSNTRTSPTTSTLSHDELSKTLHLRIDFSSDAIATVVSKLRNMTHDLKNTRSAGQHVSTRFRYDGTITVTCHEQMECAVSQAPT